MTDWSHDFDGHCEKSTVANFFQYWLSALAHNIEEVYELKLWMLNLVAHYVALNDNCFDTADESKYWGKLFLSEEDWEVPPPLWAITREKDSNEYRSRVEEERQKLVKEEEEAVVDIELEEEKEPLKVSDACTQTPKRRRSGGKATCLSTDADEEERAAQISSAHFQGGRCQAV